MIKTNKEKNYKFKLRKKLYPQQNLIDKSWN